MAVKGSEGTINLSIFFVTTILTTTGLVHACGLGCANVAWIRSTTFRLCGQYARCPLLATAVRFAGL